MNEALQALAKASRRELQTLAKELQLCRGNAKSDVIVNYAMKFLDNHPKDGEQQILGALSGNGRSSPVASPVAKNGAPHKKIKDNKQPEEEPVDRLKNESSSDETKQVTPSDKKNKQVPSLLSATTSSSTHASSAEDLQPNLNALPLTEKYPPTTDKTLSTSVEKKSVIGKKEEDLIISKKAAATGKKMEKTTRKAVEALVNSVADLAFVGESRVRCSTTGHEMLADANVINAYIHGKRYQKLRNLKLSFAKYAPMFVDHPDESKTNMLWCNVTESAIARDVKRVKEHIAAPKYQKQLSIWKEQEAVKKKAEEEENQRRAARILAAKKKRLEAAKDDSDSAAASERPTKRKRKGGRPQK